MTHLVYGSFFDEIDALHRSGREWRELAAGLAALRYADDAWKGYAISPQHLDAIDKSLRVVGSVFTGRHVLDLLQAAIFTLDSSRTTSIVRAKWKYARRLEFFGAFRCAADVYESILPQLAITATGRRTTCLIRMGLCRKRYANFDGARRAYRLALETATGSGHAAGILRARFGLADLLAFTGHLRRARSALSRLRRDARRLGAKALYARTLHCEANISHFGGREAQAVKYAYRALRLTTVPERRNPIWADIATSLVSLGEREVARDIMLRLHRTTQQQMLRWAATFSLLEIAAADGDAKAVDEYAQLLLSTRISPHQQAYLYSGFGAAYAALDRPELARDYLRRAMVIGAEHGIRQLVRDTRRQLNQDALRPTAIGADWLQSISAQLAAAGAIRSE